MRLRVGGPQKGRLPGHILKLVSSSTFFARFHPPLQKQVFTQFHRIPSLALFSGSYSRLAGHRLPTSVKNESLKRGPGVEAPRSICFLVVSGLVAQDPGRC